MSGIQRWTVSQSLHIDRDEEGAWVPVDDRTAVGYRLWQRHPRFSMLADSTMMGVLELCEELLLLTQSVRARARSRLAGSGILLIDERISPPPLEAKPDARRRLTTRRRSASRTRSKPTGASATRKPPQRNATSKSDRRWSLHASKE